MSRYHFINSKVEIVIWASTLKEAQATLEEVAPKFEYSVFGVMSNIEKYKAKMIKLTGDSPEIKQE